MKRLTTPIAVLAFLTHFVIAQEANLDAKFNTIYKSGLSAYQGENKDYLQAYTAFSSYLAYYEGRLSQENLDVLKALIKTCETKIRAQMEIGEFTCRRPLVMRRVLSSKSREINPSMLETSAISIDPKKLNKQLQLVEKQLLK